jgi:hypothetical protein
MKAGKATAKVWLSIAGLIVLFSAGSVRTEQVKNVTWEYKHLELSSSRMFESEKILDQQGREGWELTAVDREQPGGVVHVYFKRPK